VFEGEGIIVLYMGSEKIKVLNLNLNLNLRPIHGKILALLGREYERMYCTIYGRKSVRTTGGHGNAKVKATVTPRLGCTPVIFFFMLNQIKTKGGISWIIHTYEHEMQEESYLTGL